MTQSATVNKPYRLYNYAQQGYLEAIEDSFDLAFFTLTEKGANNNDTIYYSLCGPSYTKMRAELGAQIKYPTRKTVFYLANSLQTFYKSIFDTIQYEASLPQLIKERFTKVYNTYDSEEGFVRQKQTPFLKGTFIAFKTHRGKYGIMRVISDGNTATTNFVKFEVKYQR